MVHVSAGTDTYGRVKNVAGTPIVTKFAMLQFLPLYPLQSYYYTGAGPTKTTGVPFLASTQSTAIHGVPLATLDTASVLMAYARGIFATLAIVGFIVIVPGIMYLTGERLDPLAIIAMQVLMTSFIVGVVGGLLTYAIPLTPRREREIRQHCAELLNVGADPACVPPELSAAFAEYVTRTYRKAEDPRTRFLGELVLTRDIIAQGHDATRLEIKTDELLDQLRQCPRIAAK